MKYEIGEPFKDIQDYENYQFHQLFFHERMIGRAIVDNWQYRFLKHNIENGNLRKGKLINGYNLYDVRIAIFYDFDTVPFIYKRKITAKSKEEVEREVVKLENDHCFCSFKGENCDYYDEVSHTTLKLSVVKIDAD